LVSHPARFSARIRRRHSQKKIVRERELKEFETTKSTSPPRRKKEKEKENAPRGSRRRRLRRRRAP